jgi:hypothetical protein
MESLNQTQVTLLGALALAGVSAAAIGASVSPACTKLSADIRKAAQTLAEERALFDKKPVLESEWQKKKDFFYSGLSPDVALNAWVKELLNAAQSQTLTLEKLEPAGLRAEGKELSVFVSFRSDMRAFLRFAYGLAENDPLSRIQSFSVRRDEGTKIFLFELMLAKVAE